MTFEVIPSIDISQGQVVRLLRGSMDDKTVYSDRPLEVALRWASLGAVRIHVVDLDAAVTGQTRNEPVIGDIVAECGVPVQIGGGVRDLDAISSWLDAGVDRVVLGTAAFTEPPLLRAALSRFGERVVIAPDYRDREIRVTGWTKGTGLDVVDTAKVLAQMGARRLLCTDIGRDGALEGPDTGTLVEIAQSAGIPVIASGGVSSLEDIRALAACVGEGIEGVVVGRALYTGAVDPAGAIGLSC